jgi:hypothetical protein
MLAYIDPGSGSFFLQILLASLFASLFFVKSGVQKVRGWWQRLFGVGRRGEEHEGS